MLCKFAIMLICNCSFVIHLCAQERGIPAINPKHVNTSGSKDTLVSIKGSVSVNSNFYYMHGQPNRRAPFNWSYSGSPVITIKGVVIPTSFILGEQHRYFRQPFNQFGISPRYKWVTLHLGYRNLNFSPFTLGGHTMMGGGLELTPGKWRMAFMYGRLRKAIGEDPLLPYSIQAGYKRTGYGAMVAYGTKKNNVALSILRARDDTSSMEVNAISSPLITPSDNLVGGIRSTQQINLKKIKSTLTWEADVAVSAYNKDYRAARLATRRLGMWKSFTGLFKPTESLRLTTAAQTSFSFKKKDMQHKVMYRRVSPDFMSMGAYFFVTDLESITIEPSWKMWEKKLGIQSSFGLQKDNLDGRRAASTKRTIGSLNLSFEPSENYALEMQFSNYGIAQQAGLNPLNDTIRMVQVNRNISVINRYSEADQRRAKSMILMLNYQQVSDLNEFTSQFNDNKIFFANLTYSYTWIPEGTSVSGSVQHTVFSSYAGKNSIAGVTGSLSLQAAERKWNSAHSVSLFRTVFTPDARFGAADTRSLLINIVSGAQWPVGVHHKINVNFQCILQLANDDRSFTEMNGSVGYSYNF